MGCTNSFMYNSTAYKDVMYTEKVDKRLGKVFLMRSMATNTAYIAKELPSGQPEIYESKVNKYKFLFGSSSKLFLMPLSITETINVLKSEHSNVKSTGKSSFVKIEFFQRDFGDEFNVKALKQKKFYSFEIWSLIYTLVFALAAMDEHNLPIPKISFDDILITNNYYKLFYRQIFAELWSLNEDEPLTFDEARFNIAFLVFEMAKEVKWDDLSEYNPQFHDHAFAVAQFEDVKAKFEEELRSFVYNVLVMNSPRLTDFSGLRKHLVNIYDKMDYEVIDEKIIKDCEHI